MLDEPALGAEIVAMIGAAATYTPPGGVGVATSATLERQTRPRPDGVSVERITLAHLPAVDVPEPVRGALVRIGTVDWRVDALDDADDATVACVVRRA